MELVQENNKKFMILISLILAIVYIFILQDPRVTLFIGTLFIIGMIIFFTLIFYSRKKNFLIYFSENGISFEIGNKKNEFEWNDLKIELIRDHFKYLKSIDYKFSSIENNQNNLILSICWENEKSIMELTKKYVPKNHDLYIAVSVYSKKRGLEF